MPAEVPLKLAKVEVISYRVQREQQPGSKLKGGIVDTCEHPFVTEIKIKGYEHPIKCDECELVFECEHEYELTDDRRLYCWVCGYEKEEE